MFVCVCEKRLGAAGIKESQIRGESLTACWDHAHSSHSIERQQRPLDRTKPHTKKMFTSCKHYDCNKKANHINLASFDHTLLVLLSDGKLGIYLGVIPNI